AGAALAEAAYRFAGPMPALILCGPGNNGGDGYVAARHLAGRGVNVRVAALGEPKSEAGKWARSEWEGEAETLSADTVPAPLIIDALFGTGLKHGLEQAAAEQLSRLCDAALVSVAADLPSGVESDSGIELSSVPAFDMTVTFGALKPSHLLHPAMHKCGRLVLADIGIEADGDWHEIGPPRLPALDRNANKYSRGLVAIPSGQMPGAAALAATSAARAGAGTVRLYADAIVANIPAAVVQGRKWDPKDLRRGSVLIGPGLGRGSDASELLEQVLGEGQRLVIDADALRLITPERLSAVKSEQPPVITPHSGEFEHLFGKLDGSKIDQALAAARQARAVVVYKGPDTVVAAPDGRVGVAPAAPSYLASAGSGDVLAGLTASILSRVGDSFDAACAAVWLHGRAAEIAGAQMIADDLAAAVPKALALLS
ncbi:MAG: NAD(P)H-hydrate dehydratase, partial [Sphingomicrobium sp.]